MKLKIILGFLTAMMMTFALSGQKDIKKADKLLSLKAFDLAIKNYNSFISMNPTHAKAHAQLAEAYRMTNQPLEALRAYEKAFELSGDLSPEYQLNYAHTLKKVGLYNQASSWYASYNAINPTMADYWISNNEYAKELLQAKDQFDVLSFDGNSEEADFGPAFFKDKIVFSSFREDLKRENDKLNSSYINQKGNQLYVVLKEGGSTKGLSFLRPDFKETHNIGPLSYSRDGRMVAFMRNNFSKSSNFVFTDESDMSIYFAFTDDNGDFADAKPFPYNQVEYSYAFPSLGFNGSALYFASNRPGGYGGFDIYVSYFKDGKWSAPENLGPAINSSGNEITPYFDGEELYFSSDYKFGLGGYDIFSSRADNGSWTEAKNMGKGINSPSDDYYFVVDQNTGDFYYSSNRLGGRGKDDIYIAYPLAQEEELIADVIEVAVPEAVNLDELAIANGSDSFLDLEEGEITEATVIPVSSSETVTFESEALFDFEGATLTEVLTEEYDNQEVYFIQLASLAQSNGKLSNYTSVESYGSLYRFFKPNAVKIRLGYYSSKSEAESILYSVKNRGFTDAFITTDVLAVSNFELINASEYNSNSTFVDDYNISSQYKVKLASYNDPLKFNVDAIKDAGRLEQWTKGNWTIFVLGGFATIEEAKKARIMAINRGWRDAELVVDEGGVLRKITTR